MHDTIPQPLAGGRPAFDAEASARATTREERMDGSWEAMLKCRIIAREQNRGQATPDTAA
jgi:hypothetical protein